MSKITIGIIDNQLGNISSVANAINFLGENFVISSSTSVLESVDAYILPGVGAFPQAINNFQRNGYEEFLENQILIKRKPFLGICLGMQMLADTSEEQQITRGLGWISGSVTKIQHNDLHPIPHVGWNNLRQKISSPLLEKLDSSPNFYFDHSYEFIVKDVKNVVATCEYGKEITSLIAKNNIFGTQFDFC